MDQPDQYRAGLCNIGEKEIRLRKKLLFVFGIASFGFSICYLYLHEVMMVLWLTFFSSATFFLICMEVRKRFCVLFGIFNFYNFSRLGDLKSIKCKNSIRKDRLTALRMIMFSLLFAAIHVKLLYMICMLTGI